MNIIDRLPTDFSAEAEPIADAARSADVQRAIGMLDEGDTERADQAFADWLAGRKFDDDTRHDVALFQIAKARSLRRAGASGDAAMALGRIALADSPTGALAREIVEVWHETGDDRFLAGFLLAAVRSGRLDDAWPVLSSGLEPAALVAIMARHPVAEIDEAIGSVESAAMVALAAGPSWGALALILEAAGSAGAYGRRQRKLADAVNLATAQELPPREIIRLLGLFGCSSLPVAAYIAPPPYLRQALSSGSRYLARRAQPDAEPQPMALVDAIAAVCDEDDALPLSRALWWASARHRGEGEALAPASTAELLRRLVPKLGDDAGEAASLADVIEAGGRISLKTLRAAKLPEAQAAALSLIAAQAAVEHADPKQALAFVAAAEQRGAAEAPLAMHKLAAGAAASGLEPKSVPLLLAAIAARFGAAAADRIVSELSPEAARQLALRYAAGLKGGKLSEAEAVFFRALGAASLAKIAADLPPEIAASAADGFAARAVFAAASEEGWIALRTVFDRAQGAGNAEKRMQSAAGAARAAIAGGAPKPAVFRLLALVGAMARPVSEDIAPPPLEAGLARKAYAFLTGQDEVDRSAKPLLDGALAEAIIADAEAETSDPVSIVRALWWAAAYAADTGFDQWPRGVLAAVQRLAKSQGSVPHEAAALKMLIAPQRGKAGGVDAVVSASAPGAWRAALALRQADRHIVSGNIEGAAPLMHLAQQNGAGEMAIMVRLAGIAGLSSPPPRFKAALSDRTREKDVPVLISAAHRRFGGAIVKRLVDALPEQALLSDTFWNGAALAGGGDTGLLEALLVRLLGARSLPADIVYAAVKHQVAGLEPRPLLAVFGTVARLLSRVLADHGVESLRSVSGLAAALMRNAASTEAAAMQTAWSEFLKGSPDLLFAATAAELFVRNQMVDQGQKEAVAERILPILAAAVGDGRAGAIRDNALSAIAIACPSSEAAAKIVALRTADGRGRAFAPVVRARFDEAIRRRNLADAARCVDALRAIGFDETQLAASNAAIGLAGPDVRLGKVLADVPDAELLALLQGFAERYGAENAVRAIKSIEPLRLASPASWPAAARRKALFAGQPETLEAFVEAIAGLDSIDPAIVAAIGNACIGTLGPESRPGALRKLVSMIDRSVWREKGEMRVSAATAALGLIDAGFKADHGRPPELDEIGNDAAESGSPRLFSVRYAKSAIQAATVAGHEDGGHARAAWTLIRGVDTSDLLSAPERIVLLAAAGESALLESELAAAGLWRAGPARPDIALVAAARFCLGRDPSPAARSLACDILWNHKSQLPLALARLPSSEHARRLEICEWFAGRNEFVAAALDAMRILPEPSRDTFLRSLPFQAFDQQAQWSSPAAASAAKRDTDAAIGLLKYLCGKARSGATGALAGLEHAAEALLPALPRKQRVVSAAAIRQAASGAPADARWNALLSGLKQYTSAKEFDSVIEESIQSGDRRSAVMLIEQASANGYVNTERLDRYTDILIEFGAIEEAVKLVGGAGKPAGIAAALNLLKIRSAGSGKAEIEEAAKMALAGGGVEVPGQLDGWRIRLQSSAMPRFVRKASAKLLGGERSERLLAAEQAALCAMVLLDDTDAAQKAADRLSRTGLAELRVQEVGLLVFLEEFAKAETKLAALIDGEILLQSRLSRIRQPLRLRYMDWALEHAHLVQRYFLNEGRDVSFLDRLETLVMAAIRSPWRRKLSRASKGRLVNIGVSALKLRLGSTMPETPGMRALTDAVAEISEGDKAGQSKLSRALLKGWQDDTGPSLEDTAKANLAEAKAYLKKLSARDAKQAKAAGRGKPKAGIAALSRKDVAPLAKLVQAGLGAYHQLSPTPEFAELSAMARDIMSLASANKWRDLPILHVLAQRAYAVAPDMPEALAFLMDADDGEAANIRYLSVVAATLSASGDSARALSYVDRVLAAVPNNKAMLRTSILVNNNLGRAEEARSAASRLLGLMRVDALVERGQTASVRGYLDLKNSLAQMDFWADTSKIVAMRPQPRLAESKGVVFASFYKCMASASITTMPVLELKRRGYDVVYLNAGNVVAEPTGHPVLDQFRGILQTDGSVIAGRHTPTSALLAQWHIDWDKRVVSAGGVNFYQPIFERLTQQSRSYSIDIDEPQAQQQMKGMIRLFDRALHVAQRIKAEVCSLGIPVRFASSNWQYPPYAAFRIVAEAWKDECDIGFVAVSPGYESYFANLEKRYATTAAAVNMTANSESRAPFLPVRRKFEAWCEANSDVLAGLEAEVKGWIQTDRSGVGRELPPEAKAVMERIQDFRAGGGKVIGVFGKIVYDLAVPYAGGPAHTDMKDFLNHTVASAAKSDAMVLIKPHPHELRYEIARNPRELFTDMIEVPIPPNVVLLQHRWFNIRDMIMMLDLGVLWNGTTGVELGASGIPVVMCDDWGPRDYPVGHAAPRDRAHFEAIIRDPSIVQMPEGYPEKCAALLKYISTDDVMRPYPFVRRGLVNVDVGPPAWDFNEVARYMADGDRYVSALADDFAFKS